MKKIFVLSMALVLCLCTNTFAQDAAFSQGYSTVSLGYGFLSPYKTLFKLSSYFGSSEGTTTKFSATGPVGLTYEYGLSENISAGLQVGYSTLKNVQTTKDGISTGKDYVVTQKLNQLSILVRGNYHFGESEKFDPYVGLGLGYGNFKYTETDNDSQQANALSTFKLPSAFGITGQLGAKYYFSPGIGAYAEIGYLAGSFVQLGITAKF
jgi:outer membrane protein W